MKTILHFRLPQILCLGVMQLWAVALFGQMPDTYLITPQKTIMLVGESRPFRMVDQNGRAQHKVTWNISDADAFQSFEGDELWLTPKRTGEFRLRARTDFATAEATIKVMGGSALPVGTVKWSAGNMKGCTTTKIISARPVPNGPDVFEQSTCEDGEYVAAYTAHGIQLWQRKISDNGAPGGPGSNNYEVVGSRLESHSATICDSVSAGMEQQKIRDLLTQQNLAMREEPGGSHVWLVEESNTQCKMWFDEKSVLLKKRKVFVTE